MARSMFLDMVEDIMLSKETAQRENAFLVELSSGGVRWQWQHSKGLACVMINPWTSAAPNTVSHLSGLGDSLDNMGIMVLLARST